MVDRDEYWRWMGQARHTLASARRDTADGDFDWACFKAQQAAEVAVKALLHGLGTPAFGHALSKLLDALQAEAGLEVPETVRHLSRILDRHYVPPRYPDAYTAGMPFEFYDEPAAQEALDASEKVIEFVEEQASALGLGNRSDSGSTGGESR